MAALRRRSPPQHTRNFARAPPPVNDGDHQERFFVWRIRYEVLANAPKSQTSRAQVRTPMALLRESDQPADGLENLLAQPFRGAWIILGDELPDFCDIARSPRE